MCFYSVPETIDLGPFLTGGFPPLYKAASQEVITCVAPDMHMLSRFQNGRAARLWIAHSERRRFHRQKWDDMFQYMFNDR